jgi:hypothetical protein
MLNMTSHISKPFNLDVVVPGEAAGYEASIVGLLTKQWVMPKGEVGEICRFGIVAFFDSLDYWAGAENGDKKALEIVFDYIDGTYSAVSKLFVHDRTKLRPKGSDNPYVEYILSPNEYVWYRYRVMNPNPEKEVLTIGFKNASEDCTPRIGDVIHYRAKIIPGKELPE